MSPFEEIQRPDGSAAFRKYLSQGHSACFRAEARGLAAMAATETVATPEVLQVDDTQLVTRLLVPQRPSRHAWETLGTQLAQLHQLRQPCFGFPEDNYCGATPQPNTRTDDGHLFFSEQRLLFQGRMARSAGRLRSSDLDDLDSLCARLQDLIPEQAPSLLHGDLWSGNVLFCADGPYLIDPACYWGWPEADLAMTTLFGRFDNSFYESYQSISPLPPGFEERISLYNLYHLLNHLNIFGRTYHSEVVAVLRRFS